MQLGVTVRVLGEFVMILMKIEEPGRPDQQHHSGKTTDGAVQPPAAKGGGMAAFMHRGEQEHHGNPLPRHGKPAKRTLTGQIPPQAQPDQPEMPAKMDQTPQIRSRHQGPLLFGREAAQDIAMCQGEVGHGSVPG